MVHGYGKYLENSARKNVPMLQLLFWECTLKCNLQCGDCGSDCKLEDSRVNLPLDDFL